MFNVAIHVHHLVFQQYVVILSHAQHQQFSENLPLTQAMLLPSEKKKKRPLFKVENNSLSNQLLLADQHVK